MKFTVLIKGNTVGTIDGDTLDGQHADSFIGEVVKIHLHDENGNPLEKEGELLEILEEHDY